MRLSLTKLENITLTIITTLLMLSPLCLVLLVRPGDSIVTLYSFYFYKLVGKLTVSLYLQEFTLSNMTVVNYGQFHYLRATFSSQLTSKCGNIFAKDVALRIILNIDDTPVSSRSHSHPSHSQTSRLLTSSLSLGVPVPLTTQCMWDV